LTLQATWAQPVPPGAPGSPEPLILEVRVNGLAQDEARAVLRHEGRLLFTAQDLQAWRIVRPQRAAWQQDGVDYHDIAAVPGVRVTLDAASQTARIEAPPDAFEPNGMRADAAPRAVLSESTFGSFLNYDLALQHDRRGTAASGYFDAAVSGDWGVVSSSLLAGQSALGNQGKGAVRLDTAWRRDDPDRLTRFTVGDSISRAAAWSTPFRFGGVQFGTRFALQSGYISYPTPTLRGGAAVPSALEVYVNDNLRYRGRVDTGPFAVSEVPVLTGAGEMRFAVTDALGVQRTVTTPYYVSPSLLRAGLSEHSVEAGWTRLNHGARSFDYGRPFVSGNWRHGLNDGVTVEGHAEAGARSQTAGGGAQWVWAPLGEFGLHGAASRSDAGTGTLARASFARTADDWNFSASRQVASRRFTQIGWQDSANHVTAQTQLFVGRSLGRAGTLGASYTLLRFNTDERIGVLSGSWSVAVAGGAWLSAYLARTRQNSQRGAATTIGVTLTVPLGEHRSSQLALQRDRGRTVATAEVTQVAPSDSGIGWRLLAAPAGAGGGDGGGQAGPAAGDRTEASVDWRGRHGMLGADAAQRDGRAGLRLRASGALGFAG
ncbi:MAG: fimbrial biogenesis outer membrane usher protein, partial [Comamonadaceae bacterium]